jgi:hypothetical protein
MLILNFNLHLFAIPLKLKLKLKPLGFVLATGLHPLVSETAAHVSECFRFA